MVGLIYLALGYWAAGRTIYRNSIIIGQNPIFYRIFMGALLGWALIPVAVIGLIFGKK
ncbi:hypothetical protein [Bacteroides acidifaciens]|uniref:hypothetical protein n=1 Tax=Bacteroides acidifaciens TaxID=85831 RepID=UPI00263B930C|nr:hypothetical protein [Bacteroides acidifaciens]